MTYRIEGIEEWEIRHLYEEEGMTQLELSSHYGVSNSTIWNRLIEYGIESRESLLTLNDDFFKTWTSGSAWLYGWALGDGNFTNIHYLRFALSIVDKEVLEKMKILLDSTHLITQFDSWKEKYHKRYSMAAISFSSRELVNDIRKLSYLDVPEYYFNHFLRGFFEAEGSVYWHKRVSPKGGAIKSSISQNDYDILDFIYWELKELNIVKGGAINHYKSHWKLYFSVNDSISLYHYLYDDCGDNFLKRKKEKFEELIGRHI